VDSISINSTILPSRPVADGALGLVVAHGTIGALDLIQISIAVFLLLTADSLFLEAYSVRLGLLILRTEGKGKVGDLAAAREVSICCVASG
jgi:hypothetical protein